MKQITIHALLIVVLALSSLSKATAAEADTDKCQNDSYLENARDLFTCDASWFVDSCSRISGVAAPFAGGMAGALVKPIQSRLNDEMQKRRFQKFSELQTSFVKKSAEGSKAIQDFLDIDKKWGNVFGNLEDAQERMVSKIVKPNPEKLAQAQKDYDEAKNKPGFAEDEKRYRELKELRTKLFNEDHQLSKQLTAYENKLKVGRTTSGRAYDLLGSKLDVARAEVDGEDSQKLKDNNNRMEQEVQKRFMEEKEVKLKAGESIRGGLIGAGVGVAISALPYALNLTNSKLCGNISDAQIRDYVTIRRLKALDNCTVTLEDDKEMQILAKSSLQQKDLFQKYPLLCQAFVKKTENRRSQLAKSSAQAYLNNCAQGKADASVDYNGHHYRFSVQNDNGETKISGPFGSGDQIPQNPITINWKFNPKTGEASHAQLDPARFDSSKGDLNYLRNVQSVVGLDIKPMSPQENSLSGRTKMQSAFDSDILATMAEQSTAIKLALPQVMASCGSMQNGGENDSQSGGSATVRK